MLAFVMFSRRVLWGLVFLRCFLLGMCCGRVVCVLSLGAFCDISCGWLGAGSQTSQEPSSFRCHFGYFNMLCYLFVNDLAEGHCISPNLCQFYFYEHIIYNHIQITVYVHIFYIVVFICFFLFFLNLADCVTRKLYKSRVPSLRLTALT